MGFIQAVLNNKKKVFLNQQVRRLHVPKWDEISIARILPMARMVPTFDEYFPDEWLSKPDKINRFFFWDVLASLDPDFVHSLLNDLQTQRNELEEQRRLQRQPTLVGVEDNWARLLDNAPFRNSKYPLSFPLTLNFTRTAGTRQGPLHTPYPGPGA